jgi:thiol-disulfide isomerase/thioredoxin
MTKKLIVLSFLCAFTISTFSQGIKFDEGTWSSVLQKAKQSDKLVFIDIYTSWCGPCKKMAKETFTKPTVGNFYNSNFINYHIDAEKGEGIAIAKKYQVTAYPTCLFVTSDGEIAYKFLGAKDTIAVMKEGQNALKCYKLMPQMKAMSQKYSQGCRDKAFLKEYVTMLSQTGKTQGTVLNDYLKALTDEEFYSKKNIKLLLGVTVYDKALFDRIVAYDKKTGGADSIRKRITIPVMRAISGCMTPMLGKNNAKYQTEFEHLLSVKSQLNIESNFLGKMFGGISYEDTDRLRISFYENADKAKFRNLVDSYMKKHLIEDKADSIQRIFTADRIAQKQKLESLKNDSLEVAKYKKSLQFGMLANAEYQSDSYFLIDCVNNYWDSLKSHTATDRAKMKKWLLHADKLYDIIPTATECARSLMKIGEKETAKEVLKKGIEGASYDVVGMVNDKNITEAKDLFKKL